MPEKPEPNLLFRPERVPAPAVPVGGSIKELAAWMATTSEATAHFIAGPHRETLSVKLLRDED